MKRILIIRSDRFGEFLLALSAVKLVRDNFPQSLISLLARKPNFELIRGINFIDKFIEYDDQAFSGFSGAFKLAKQLRKENFDCVLVLNPKKEFHLASFLAGIPVRVGYDRKWGWCLNRKIKDLKYLEQKHEVEYNIALASLICKNSFIPEVNFPVDGKESLNFLKEKVDLSKKYIVLHSFTSNPLKKVAGQFWRNLAGELKRESIDLVLIGSSQEKEEAIALAKEIGAVSLAGNLSLRNLASFFKYNCRAFIGLDSGPLHLASLLKLPVVGLYNVSNPKRWSPYKTDYLIVQGKSCEDFAAQIGKIVDFVSRYY